MGWFDQLAYTLAPIFGPIGKAISDANQDTRLMDAAKAYRDAPDLSQFSSIQTPDNIYDPAHMIVLEKMKDLRKGDLQQNEAAPVLSRIQQFQADPRWQDAESMREVAKDPMAAAFNPDERPDFTGVVPGMRKGSTAAAGPNPFVAKGIKDFVDKTQNTMDVYNAHSGDPMALARVAVSPVVQGFHQAEQGGKLANDVRNTNDELTREKKAVQVYNETPVTTDPADMEKFKSKVRAAGGTSKATDSLLKDFEAKNDPYKHLDEAALTLKALQGGPEGVEAQKVLDAMQGRKVRIAQESRPPKSEKDDKYDRRQTDKEFQNDLTYLRSLDRAVATGGKGMIMINGIPTSFDGSVEALESLKGMQGDQESTMHKLYPDKMKARRPAKEVKPPAPKPAGQGVNGTSWKKIPK